MEAKKAPKGTLRDQFAGSVAAGLAANPNSDDLTADGVVEAIAREAYRCADALMQERDK